MAEEKKVVMKLKANSKGLIKVKNTGKSILNLANGGIPSGGEGVATVAEVSTLGAYLKVL